jgi:hypothetical protein
MTAPKTHFRGHYLECAFAHKPHEYVISPLTTTPLIDKVRVNFEGA